MLCALFAADGERMLNMVSGSAGAWIRGLVLLALLATTLFFITRFVVPGCRREHVE